MNNQFVICCINYKNEFMLVVKSKKSNVMSVKFKLDSLFTPYDIFVKQKWMFSNIFNAKNIDKYNLHLQLIIGFSMKEKSFNLPFSMHLS